VARKASIEATNALAASTVIDSSNNQFAIVIDGRSSNLITLQDGDYDQDQLAAALQASINADDGLIGREVTVGVQNGKLNITSNLIGSSSEISFCGVETTEPLTALATLGIAGDEFGRGQDVVGTFTVDGEIEAAIGRGNLLSGTAEGGVTDDLQVRVTLNASQLSDTPEAKLTLTRGIGARLDKIIHELQQDTTDENGRELKGKLATAHERFDETIVSIQASIDRLNARFESEQQSLIEQFAAMESAVGQLQTTSSFLATQLASASAISVGQVR